MLKSSTISEHELKRAYRDMIDECHPIIKIGHATFYASSVLYDCDRVAYSMGLSEYVDSLIEEGYVILWDDPNRD